MAKNIFHSFANNAAFVGLLHRPRHDVGASDCALKYFDAWLACS